MKLKIQWDKLNNVMDKTENQIDNLKRKFPEYLAKIQKDEIPEKSQETWKINQKVQTLSNWRFNRKWTLKKYEKHVLN